MGEEIPPPFLFHERKKEMKSKYNTPFEHQYIMKSNGIYASLNMPEAYKSQLGEDETETSIGRLPPYNRRQAFLVDEYPSCPSNWMRSTNVLSSYFVPVQNGHAMWLDFNHNDTNTHHVAVVISIQGINPLTGLTVETPRLEQYVNNCPKCDTELKHDRLCPKCDMKYPKQNYLCTNATLNGFFWIDGFRMANGIISQYIFSEETMRGVASNLIGKDKVYAIGLTFFLSKEAKPLVNQVHGEYFNYLVTSAWNNNAFLDIKYKNAIDNPNVGFGTSAGGYTTDTLSTVNTRCEYYSGDRIDIVDNVIDMDDYRQLKSLEANTISKSQCKTDIDDYRQLKSLDVNTVSKPQYKTQEISISKKMEIGAGAQINQQIYDDPEKLDYWREDIEAMICINYCSEQDADNIVKNGKVSIDGNSKGFLKNIKTGN